MARLSRNVGKALGFRSGLEAKVAEQIAAALGPSAVEYESKAHIIEYTKPERKAKYTPDFPLPNGIIVETKGRFVTADRQKHLLIKEQHPQKDIRFVFTNPNARISKTSATTYAMWCEKHGFKYAKATIPPAWFKETT
jgi:LytS/YehU family sensor histidine kinase